MRKSLLYIVLLACCVVLPLQAQADAVRFGVPPWPGVTVKTEVLAQIIEAMGYDTEQLEVGPAIVYNGLTTGDVDVYVASWIPLQNEMFRPLKEKNAVDIVGVNLDEAGVSLAVPTYVWEAGVRSIADLDKYADKFDHTIYSIEVGSGMQVSTEQIVKNDVAGLGDWKMLCSPVPAMIRAVQDKVRAGEWVVFHGWQPHWMIYQMDMKFLEGVPGTEGLVNKSTVYTLASLDFRDRFPQVHKFLANLYIKGATQSEWINEYGFKKRKPADVARDWIGANLDTVETWLKGVNAADGTPGIDAVRAAFS